MGSQSWFGHIVHRHVIVLLGFIFALLSAQAFAAPANDNFASAFDLGNSLSGSVTGTNVDATTEPNELTLSSTGATVWWAWTAPATGSLVVDTFSSNFDTTLTLLSGSSLATLSPLVFNDDSNGIQSSVIYKVTQGNTYYFSVGGSNNGANNGNITLNWALTTTNVPQTIYFPAISDRLASSDPFYITALASSGLAVSFASATPATCAISGNTVSLLAAGTCAIRANQAGNATYAPAPQVTQSFTVGQSGFEDLTVVNTADSNVTGATPFTPTGSSAAIRWATINKGLESGNVILTTVGTSAVSSGSIFIEASGTLTGTNTLTFDATGDINQLASSDVTYSKGNLIFQAADNITLNANVTASNLTLTAAAGTITQSAGTITAATTTVAAGANAVTLTQATNDFGSIGATGGAVSIRGHQRFGIRRNYCI